MSRIDNNTKQLANCSYQFQGKINIPREETKLLFDWIQRPYSDKEDSICLLVGTAGQGKTVVLHDLMSLLQQEKDHQYITYALKSDLVDFKEFMENDLVTDYKNEFDRLTHAGVTPILIIDQIDALSKTLSVERTPIIQLDKLIGVIAPILGAKIIVSCRPYDLNYDPLLKKYKHKNKITLGSLSYEEVRKVLESFGKKVCAEESKLFNFLKTPVNLEYYLEYGRDDQEDISLQSLMDQLWSDKIVDAQTGHEHISFGNLFNCMKCISESLNNTSSLAFAKKKFEGRFAAELNYLVSENILRLDNETNQMTFYHQTLADYVTARVTYESGTTMAEILEKEHQGLYVRNRVKQYFTYVREAAPDEYINEIRAILIDDTSGKYRIHIKMLLLSTIAGFEHPSCEEKEFVNHFVLNNNQLCDIFVESIVSETWFNYLVNTQTIKNALAENDTAIVNLLKRACINVMMVAPDEVAKFLNSQIRKGDLAWNEQWMSVINGYAEPRILIPVKPLFEASFGELAFTKYHHYLKCLAKQDYAYVEKLILNYVESSLKEQLVNEDKNEVYSRIEYMDQEVYLLLDDLFDDQKETVASTYIKIIETIDDVSRYTPQEDLGLQQSRAYFMFSSSSMYNTHERLVNDYIDYAREIAKNTPEAIRPMVNKYMTSGKCIILYIGIQIIRANLEAFKQEAVKIVSDKYILESLGSNVYYQVFLILKELFPLLDEQEKDSVLDVIASVNPQWQNTPFPDLREFDRPLYHIGRRKQELLSAIPEDYLKSKRPREWKFLQEKDRDFGKASVHEPFKTYVTSGWASHGLANMRAMKMEDMLHAFKIVDSDAMSIYNKPTLHGECINFEILATEDPKKYVPVIERILDNQEINREYVAYGISGLKKGNYETVKIKELTERLIIEIGDDAVKEGNESLLMTVIRGMDYFINLRDVSPVMMDFMCKIVKSYPDKILKNDDQANDSDVYNVGINRVRGCAAYHLVKCYLMKEYAENIFEALEACKDATPATRGAIILQQALLNHLDPKRNLKLYLSLTEDLTPSLVRIELNDLHPLLYMVNTSFEELKVFLWKLFDIEVSHDMLSQLLWLAWKSGNDQAGEMLHELLDKSEKAKACIIKFFNKDTIRSSFDYVLPVVEWCRNGKGDDLGRMLDFLMDDLEVFEWQQVIKVVDLYVKGIAFRYAGRNFLEMLEEQAGSHPTDVLRWICEYANTEHKDSDSHYLSNQAMTVLVAAYNAIRKYDKNNELLEKALDTMDVLLMSQDVRSSVKGFLYQLDNK